MLDFLMLVSWPFDELKKGAMTKILAEIRMQKYSIQNKKSFPRTQNTDLARVQTAFSRPQYEYGIFRSFKWTQRPSTNKKMGVDVSGGSHKGV